MKTSSAMSILNELKRRKAPVLEKLLVQERPGRWIHRFWQEGGGHDLNIWTMKKAVEKAEYCHNNPVKRQRCHRRTAGAGRVFGGWCRASAKGEPLRVDDWDEALVSEPLDVERSHRDRH
ncbi:MAG TPA: hypothetical protein VEJ63_03935, partial [Planctomycetota bacterium]|nr:hypothetical protein [Planctomycetota bacterium]